MFTSRLLVAAVLAAIAPVSLLAQGLTGTYTAPNNVGGAVTLTLTQRGSQVTGTLSGNGVTFTVQGRVDQDGDFSGVVQGPQGQLYIEGELDGGQLMIVLAEMGPSGEPNLASAQELAMTRVSGRAMAAPPAAGPAAPRPLAPSARRAPAAGAARGDPFAGTFSGSGLTVTLQGRDGAYQGQATYQGAVFPLQAQGAGNQLQGVYAAEGQQYPFEALVQGDQMQFSAGGQTYLLQRGGGAMGAAPLGQAGGQAGGAAALASTPQDQQIAQLLLSSAWCSFSFNQTSGATDQERFQFAPDGTLRMSSNRETYSSGRYGAVAGQYGGGAAARWRVQNGMLMVAQDGVNFTAVPLQISRNSSGYPIVTAGGTEYAQCQ
jgi:hypothetical protein